MPCFRLLAGSWSPCFRPIIYTTWVVPKHTVVRIELLLVLHVPNNVFSFLRRIHRSVTNNGQLFYLSRIRLIFQSSGKYICVVDKVFCTNIRVLWSTEASLRRLSQESGLMGTQCTELLTQFLHGSTSSALIAKVVARVKTKHHNLGPSRSTASLDIDKVGCCFFYYYFFFKFPRNFHNLASKRSLKHDFV